MIKQQHRAAKEDGKNTKRRQWVLPLSSVLCCLPLLMLLLHDVTLGPGPLLTAITILLGREGHGDVKYSTSHRQGQIPLLSGNCISHQLSSAQHKFFAVSG